jgi:hypothetical protein
MKILRGFSLVILLKKPVQDLLIGILPVVTFCSTFRGEGEA